MDPKPKPARRRIWRILLTTFKWCRIAVLLIVLVAILLSLFLNDVGLPSWLEKRVEDQFRAKGWEMKFSRLRLRWYRGIVAEDLQLERRNSQEGPHLFVQSTEFRLNWAAFKNFDLEPDAALLRGGRLIWPLPGTNQPRRTFVLDDVAGELLFCPGDLWELKFFQARLLGTQVRFRGQLTNASFLRDWKMPASLARPDTAGAHAWQQVLAEAQNIRYAGRPELNVIFSGDARDWKRLEASLKFTGLGVRAPWGGGTNVSFTAHLLPPPNSNDAIRADLKLTAQQAQCAWGSASNLEASAVLEPSLTRWLPTNALSLIELTGVQTPWGHTERLFAELRSAPNATNAALNQTRLDLTLENLGSRDVHVRRAYLTATGTHTITNLLPAAFDMVCTLQEARTPWLTSRWVQAVTRSELPVLDHWRLTQADLEWPKRLRHFPLLTTVTLSNVASLGLQTEQATLKSRWHFPNLELEAAAYLNDGPAQATAAWQVETRELQFRAQADFSPHHLAPLLNTNLLPWLTACTFGSPPRIQAQGHITLPAGIQGPPYDRTELLPLLTLSGQLDALTGACRGVTFSSLQAPFALTNQVWTVPAFKLTRPDGTLEITGSIEARSGNFSAAVQSRLDPMALRPLFPRPEHQRVFDFFEFSVPPSVRGEISGNLQDISRLTFVADAALTNAHFRGQSVQSCITRVVYRDRFISILKPVVLRVGEQGTAAGIGIDLERQRLFLTNAVGRLSPRAISRCIGPETDRAIEPYVFDEPPNARVEGTIPLGRSDGSENMRFELDGGPFHWQSFNLEHIQGVVLWRGNNLTLTNVQGRWRGAPLAGWVYFDFSPLETDLFSFQLNVTNVDLRTVLRDIQPRRTNLVEGTISGELRVTRADTHNWKSWQGYGQVAMTNGLLWNIPLFGAFSPGLNAIMPGLGNSRARQAVATFILTNSVLYSKDLEIRATAMRMRYQGSVDFDQRVDGRMEAELLRDLPVFGLLMSKVLWPVTKLFEYKVSGTLENPKTDELFMISRILLMPLHPLKTLKDIFNVEDKPPM